MTSKNENEPVNNESFNIIIQTVLSTKSISFHFSFKYFLFFFHSITATKGLFGRKKK